MIEPFLNYFRYHILELKLCITGLLHLVFYDLKQLVQKQVPEFVDHSPYDQHPLPEETTSNVADVYQTDIIKGVIYSRYKTIGEFIRELCYCYNCLLNRVEYTANSYNTPVCVIQFFTTSNGNLYTDPLVPWESFVFRLQMLESLHELFGNEQIAEDETTQVNLVRTKIVLLNALNVEIMIKEKRYE